MKTFTFFWVCVYVSAQVAMAADVKKDKDKDDAPFAFIGARVAKINTNLLVGKVSAPKSTPAGGGMGNALANQQMAQVNKIMEDQFSEIDKQIAEMKEKMAEPEADTQMYASMIKIMEENKQMLQEQMKGMMQDTNTGAAKKGWNSAAPGRAATLSLGAFPATEGMNGYKPGDWDATGEWAISVASDMATAAVFGDIPAGLMQAASLAVSVYPHPLVFNNYAGLLIDSSPADALFFLLGALAYEPRNPIILSNVGMAYVGIGDYGAAKRYAQLALQSNPQCGQAYQILTLCHLKDNNSVLAAETLFKSTLDCIDDMTEMLFDSYFDAIGELNPTEDDFPINDIVLELMYETARKYVDTAHVNESKDSPTAQLTIKPYPVKGDGERVLMAYPVHWMEYTNEQSTKSRKLERKIKDLEKTAIDKEGEDGSLVVMSNLRQYYAYLVLENYYKFQYSKTSYDWHYDKDKDTKRHRDAITQEEYDERLWRAWHGCVTEELGIMKEGADKISELEKENEKLSKEADDVYEAAVERQKAAGLGPAVVQRSPAHVPALGPIFKRQDAIADEIKEAKLSYAIQFYSKRLASLSTLYRLCKEYAEKVRDMDKAYYDENKQLMEEFWLKAGGILKYMTDPDMLEMCEQRREKFVLDRVNVWTYLPSANGNKKCEEFMEKTILKSDESYFALGSGVGALDYLSWIFYKSAVDNYYHQVERCQNSMKELQAELANLVSESPHLKQPEPPLRPKLGEFEGSPVEVEGNALQVYKDQHSEPEYVFYCGGFSAVFSGGESVWSTPEILGKKYSFNPNTGNTTTINSGDIITPADRASDFKPLSNVKNWPTTANDVAARSLDAADAMDKMSMFAKIFGGGDGPAGSFFDLAKGAADVVSSIDNYVGIARAGANVKTAGEVTRATYVTRDRRGRVIDRGDIYERKTGGEIGLPAGTAVGLERKTTVWKSKMTNTTLKRQTLEQKFKFGVAVGSRE